MSSDKTITLETSDKKLIVVEELVAMESETVKSYLEVATNPTIIPLPNVASGPLSRIIDYCKNHLEFRAKSTPEEEVKAYDTEFLNKESDESIKELILAANYLEMKELLELTEQDVAGRIKNKSVGYIRKYFGIENDYTPEEEEKIRGENSWVFEGVDQD